MLRTLYAKLSLVLLLLLLGIGLLYALISSSLTKHYLQQVNQQFNRDLASKLVADRNLVAEGRLHEPALRETFRQYMVINPSIEIYLLDLDGTILSYSADPGKVKRKSVSLEPIRAFLQGRGEYPLLGDDPRSHDRHKAFSVTPVPSAEHPRGYLYVVLRGEEFEAVEEVIRDSYFSRLSAWALAGSLGFGLLAGLLIQAGWGFMTWSIREGKAVASRRDRIDGNGINGLEGMAGVCLFLYNPANASYAYKVKYYDGIAAGHTEGLAATGIEDREGRYVAGAIGDVDHVPQRNTAAGLRHRCVDVERRIDIHALVDLEEDPRPVVEPDLGGPI